MNKPTFDIFYKTYKPDFWLIHISLETLKRNVLDYRNIIILVPEDEKHEFDTRNLPERTLIYYIKEYGNRYLYQQVCKLNVYKYCNADYIVFADSDMVWDRKIDFNDLLVDGKPEILYTDYEKIEDAKIWQAPTSKFIGEEVQYEFMRRHNVYHRSTFEAIAKFAPELEKTIMGSAMFSEFNAAGCYAYKYEQHKYRFTNTDSWSYVPPYATQFWSHCDKDGDLLHVKEYVRFLEALLRAYEIPVPTK